jgi:uncharacterized membrane protein
MAEPDDLDRTPPQRDPPQATSFHQQGQQVHGPQYNADKIEIHISTPGDAKAEGDRRQSKPRPVKSQAEIERERAQRQEADDIRYYGYRYYTRDRNRWLQTLTPQKRAAEEKRVSELGKYGGSRARHHRRILHAGRLPPDTSPADPRYVQAKQNLESGQDRRGRLGAIAAVAAMLALVLIAILDQAFWFVAVLVIAGLIGLWSGLVKHRTSMKRSGARR